MSALVQSLSDLPILEVPVCSLSVGRTPRTGGHDEHVVRLLAELDRPWPPLLVQQRTHRVIDGVHRLLAARLRGDETTEVRLYDCDDADAFVLAVQANVTHGLPLSLHDRKAAAAQIMELHPAWSNRRVATTTGLSDKTVAAVRRDGPMHGAEPERTVRVGLDGRRRPIDAAAQRATVSGLLEQHPGSSLREIAALAGVSPETVRSVKARAAKQAPQTLRPAGTDRAMGEEAKRHLQLLLRDPALRSTDGGRLLLQVLSVQAVLDSDPAGLVAAVPEHGLSAVEELARASAATWHSLAHLASGRRGRRSRETSRLRSAA